MTYNSPSNQLVLINRGTQQFTPQIKPYNQHVTPINPQTALPTQTPPTTCPNQLNPTKTPQNLVWSQIPQLQRPQISPKPQGNYPNPILNPYYQQIWRPAQTYTQPMTYQSPIVSANQQELCAKPNDVTPLQKNSVEQKLEDTIKRQRELIGKLVTAIIHDRLRSHKQNPTGDVSDDVDKLLTSHEDLLHDISYEAISAIRLYRSRKIINPGNSRTKKTKRTRKATSEKKFHRKRNRKWTRSPPISSRRHASSSNVSHSTTGCDVTKVKQWLNRTTTRLIRNNSIQRRVYEAGDASSSASQQLDDVSGSDVTLNDFRKMKFPDSRLYSLRQEFARQLKLLKDEFEIVASSTDTTDVKPTSHHGKCDSNDWKPLTSSAMTSSSEDLNSMTSCNDESPDELLNSLEKKYKLRQRRKLVPWSLRSKPLRNCRKFRCSQHSVIMTSESDSDDITINRPRHISGTNENFQARAMKKIKHMRAVWRKVQSKEPRLTDVKYLRKDKTTGVELEGSNQDPRLPTDERGGDYLIDRFLNLPSNNVGENFSEQAEEKSEDDLGNCIGDGGNDVAVNIQQNLEENKEEDTKSSKSDIFKDSTTQSGTKLDFTYDDITAPDVIEEIVIEQDNEYDNGPLLPRDTSTPEKPGEEKDMATLEEFPCELLVADVRSITGKTEVSDDKNEKFENIPATLRESSENNKIPQGRQLVAKFRPLNEEKRQPTLECNKSMDSISSSVHLQIVSDFEASLLEPIKKENKEKSDKKISKMDEQQDCPLVTETPLSDEKSEDFNKEEIHEESEDSLTSVDDDPNIDIKNISSEISLVEWGLVPRKAMAKAKERIQKQLRGLDSSSTQELSSGKKSSRKMSLRSCVGSVYKDCDDVKDTKPHISSSSTHSSGKEPANEPGSDSDLPPVPWLSTKTKEEPMP
nr:uncharacterized protein LOC100181172 isoform X2 [Ciona intestinalis]|eukprot:XP_026690864.1 uncharacterized protein LOC100181172 isoform X2 [Ciona intestinalis]